MERSTWNDKDYQFSYRIIGFQCIARRAGIVCYLIFRSRNCETAPLICKYASIRTNFYIVKNTRFLMKNAQWLRAGSMDAPRAVGSHFAKFVFMAGGANPRLAESQSRRQASMPPGDNVIALKSNGHISVAPPATERI